MVRLCIVQRFQYCGLKLSRVPWFLICLTTLVFSNAFGPRIFAEMVALGPKNIRWSGTACTQESSLKCYCWYPRIFAKVAPLVRKDLRRSGTVCALEFSLKWYCMCPRIIADLHLRSLRAHRLCWLMVVVSFLSFQNSIPADLRIASRQFPFISLHHHHQQQHQGVRMFVVCFVCMGVGSVHLSLDRRNY